MTSYFNFYFLLESDQKVAIREENKVNYYISLLFIYIHFYYTYNSHQVHYCSFAFKKYKPMSIFSWWNKHSWT